MDVNNNLRKKVSNWIFPQIRELGCIDKKLIHHKEKLLAQYHPLVDNFFVLTPLNEHYKIYLSILNPSQQKAFKSRCLTMYLMLMKTLQDNPQQYMNEPSIATTKALIYWHMHLIRKYVGIMKYTQKLETVALSKPSGNDRSFDISKVMLKRLVDRNHNRLFELYFKIYKI